MGILNYTTQVPVQRTVAQIQGILVSHGAKSIMINYTDSKEPESLSFMVRTPQGDLPFRLPANVKAVEKIMFKEHLKGYRKEGQPARVAWRILKDWVEAQMAILEADMVTMEQVFLPYMITKDNKTVYELMVDHGFYLPEGRG
jgi:hypothetical protein